MAEAYTLSNDDEPELRIHAVFEFEKERWIMAKCLVGSVVMRGRGDRFFRILSR